MKQPNFKKQIEWEGVVYELWGGESWKGIWMASIVDVPITKQIFTFIFSDELCVEDFYSVLDSGKWTFIQEGVRMGMKA